MLRTHEPDPERDRHPPRGAGTPDGEAQAPAELVAGVRDEIALRSEENWYTMQAWCAAATVGLGVVLLDSAVLFAVQAALHETISILIPMAIMLIQTAAGIAFLHVQARRCAAELTQSA